MSQQAIGTAPGLWLAGLGLEDLGLERLGRWVDDGRFDGVLCSWPALGAVWESSSRSGSALRLLAQAGWNAERMVDALAASVVRSAATLLLPIHERTNGRRGFAAAIFPPGAGADEYLRRCETVAALVNRPNMMLGLPCTSAGLAAAERAAADGQGILMGPVASLEALTDALGACARGLTARRARGSPKGAHACIVAFDPGPVCAAVEAQLTAQPGGRAERAAALADKTLPSVLQLAQAQVGAAQGDAEEVGAIDLLVLTTWDKVKPGGGEGVPPGSTPVGQAARDLSESADDLLRVGLSGDWAMMSSARAHFDALASLGISVGGIGIQADDAAQSAGAKQMRRIYSGVEAVAMTMRAELGDLAPDFARVLHSLQDDRVAERVWRGDTTLWTQDPSEAGEASRRLGWLLLPEAMQAEVGELAKFADELGRDGFGHAVVLGMGGSSLAPDVFRRMLGGRRGLQLHVLDSTDPEMVEKLARSIPVEETLFLVSSKSGTTTEPLALLEYFWAVAEPRLGKQAGRHFAAITDPGTPLQHLAEERGFRRVFAGPPDVGGRYSALSAFGLVPAALIGADVAALLQGAEGMARACGPTVEAARNPGLHLGAFLGLAAERGRDKLTFLADRGLEPLEDWIEQLIAESSGKKGRGLLPVTHEVPGDSADYGADRAFAYLRDRGEQDARVTALARAGHPVAVLDVGAGESGLGAEFFRWEFATAVACHCMGVNAFDQPDVQRAKDRTSELLKSYRRQGALPTPQVLWQAQGVILEGREGSLDVTPDDSLEKVTAGMLEKCRAGDAICFLAYLPAAPSLDAEFQQSRSGLRQARRMASSLGYGPRYLHSTGQYHKGGPDRSVFILLTADRTTGVAVPGMGVTFNVLQRAQAIGDLQALLALGRRAYGFHLDTTERLAGWFAAFHAACAIQPAD